MTRRRSIAYEIKQTKPFPSRAEEATISLLRTTDRLRRSIAAVIEPYGITAQQYNVLRILRGAGKDGLPTLEIAERMVEKTPGITRLLDRLEAKDLVKRERCPEDRRQVLCYVTTIGLRILAELDQPVASADRAAIAPLSASEQKSLIALLEKLRSAC